MVRRRYRLDGGIRRQSTGFEAVSCSPATIIRGFFHERKHTVQKSTYNGKGKVKIVVEVAGMQCGHCEANINDAIRNHFNVTKVSSSHTKGQVTIIANHDIDTDQIQNVIDESGYQYIGLAKYNI